MISIICVYNNFDIMEKYLLNSLKKQSFKDYEIIEVDSKKLGFKSADEALNYGASQSTGDLLLFCHQDISFNDVNSLSDIVKYCKTFDFGIAGVAGTFFEKDGVYSNVVHGVDYEPAGMKINKIMKCATLDECLLIIKKKSFMGFNSYSSWHLYAVEYSLRCNRMQKDVLILPVEIYHLSPGWSLNSSYYEAAIKLCKDYKDFSIIPTTITRFKNNIFVNLTIKLRILKRKLRKQ